MPAARHERARLFRARAEVAACLSPHTDEDRESFTGNSRFICIAKRWRDGARSGEARFSADKYGFTERLAAVERIEFCS